MLRYNSKKVKDINILYWYLGKSQISGMDAYSVPVLHHFREKMKYHEYSTSIRYGCVPDTDT